MTFLMARSDVCRERSYTGSDLTMDGSDRVPLVLTFADTFAQRYSLALCGSKRQCN